MIARIRCFFVGHSPVDTRDWYPKMEYVHHTFVFPIVCSCCDKQLN